MTTIDLDKAVLDLLNRVFHDEIHNCSNLMTALQLRIKQVEDLTDEEAVCFTIIKSVLEARIQIGETVRDTFYELRKIITENMEKENERKESKRNTEESDRTKANGG